MSHKLQWLAFLFLPATLTACPDEARRPIGATCNEDAACLSGLCAENVCLEPTSDNDGDGLTNEFEAQIGSNPLEKDTDGDSVTDAEELAADRSLTDTDLDGHADIVESKTADQDGDCITDQYDADDKVMSTDLSPMLPVVCRRAGICAEPAPLSVACPAGVATCVYSAVPAFADPETLCDRLDENCDGTADEGFADVNGDHIGDACEALHTLVFRNVPTVVTAGVPFAVALVLQNERDQDVIDFTPPEVLLALDPADAGFLSGTSTTAAGAVTFATVTIAKVGEGQVLVATAGTFTARSTPIAVTSAGVPAPRFVDAPTSVPAGLVFPLSVEVRMPDGALATDYAGTLAFTSSDEPAATLPAPVTLTPADGGKKVVSGFALQTLGTRHLKVRDAALGTEGEIALEVIAGSDTRLELTGLATATAGAGYTLRVRALDQFGNLLSDYTGSLRITANDDGARLPADLVVGTAIPGEVTTDQIVFHAAKDTILTVTDTSDAAITTNHLVHVAPGARATLELACSTATVAAGTPFDCTARARDAEGNLATGYTGTMRVTSSDTSLVIADLVFGTAEAGERTMKAFVFQQAGERTLTIDDGTAQATATLMVDHGPASVVTTTALPLNMVAGVASAFTIHIWDAFNNPATRYAGTLSLTASDARALVPAEVSLAASDAGVRTMTVAFATAGQQSVTVHAPAFPEAYATAEVATQVAPAAVATAAWRLQPAAGEVNVAMASVEIGLFDAFGNLATNAAETEIRLRLGRNPERAHLAGVVPTATVGGLARFADWTLDQAGDGITLIAEVAGLGAVPSARFDVTWRPPVVSAVKVQTDSGGCVPISYTVSQPDAHPVDIVVERTTSEPGNPWRRVPLAGVWGDGALQLPTTAAGIDRTYVWDFARDYHFAGRWASAGSVRVTARIGKVSASAVNSEDAPNRDRATPIAAVVPIALAAPVGRMAAGDVDGDGYLDVVIPGANATLAVMSAGPDGTFEENNYDLFIQAGSPVDLADVAVARVDAGPPAIALLDRGHGTVWMSAYNGDGGFNANDIRPCGPDQAVAMTFGHFGFGRAELAVGCDGAGPYWVVMALNSDGWYQAANHPARASVRALAAADLDRDGDDDVVAGTDLGLSVWHNIETAMAPTQDLPLGAPVVEVVLSDRSGDGVADAAFRDGSEFGIVEGLLGTLTFDPTVRRSPGLVNSHVTDLEHMGTMDFDHDGREDLLVTSPTDGAFLDRGTIGFAPNGPEALPGTYLDGQLLRTFVRLPRPGLRDEVALLYQGVSGTWSFGVWRQESELCTLNANVPQGAESEAPRLAQALDANRDGKVDLLGFYDQGGFPHFSVSFGRGDGGFDERLVDRGLEVMPYAVSTMTTGDFNGDGLPEIILGYADGQIEIYRANDNDGFRYSGPTSLAETYDVTALATADVDNDGQLDLLVATGDEALTVYYPLGLDFASGASVRLPDLGTITHITVGDLDVDGHLEVAYGVTNARHEVCVLSVTADPSGQAQRAFGAPSCLPTEDGLPPAGDDVYDVAALTIGDLTGAGRRELAVALSAIPTEMNPLGAGWVVVRAPSGAGLGTLGIVHATPLCTGLERLALGRFDDAIGLDLAVTCRGAGTLETYLQDATGFVPVTRMSVDSTYERPLATGDFDGDGRDDIAFDAAAYGARGPLGAPQDDGVARAFQATPDRWQAGATLDYNGDRTTDFVAAGTTVYDTGDGNGCDVTIEIGDPFATHASYTLQNVIYPSYLDPKVHVATGDFDGDRRSDLALFFGESQYEMQLRVVYRDTLGGLDPNDHYDRLLDYDMAPEALAASDVDRDGLDDIVVAGANSDAMGGFQVFENHQDGNGWQTWFPYNIGDVPTNVRQIVVADFDRGASGHELAIVGSCPEAGECIRFFRDEGCYPGNSYCFAYYDSIPGNFRGFDATFAKVAPLDVNHDGSIDLVVTTADALADLQQHATVLLMGQPTGGFAYVRDYFTWVGPATLPDLVVADLDADGLVDLVTASEIGKARVDVRVALGRDVEWRYGSVAAGRPLGLFPVRANDRLGVLLLEAGGLRLLPQLTPD